MARRNIQIATTTGACLLLALCSLWTAVAAAVDHSAQEQPPPSVPTPPAPTPETRPLVLLVTVFGLEAASESPVTGATVKVFAEDHEEGHETDAAGTVTFKFTTKAKTMVLRVMKASWHSQQVQLDIDAPEKTQKVVLRTSD